MFTGISDFKQFRLSKFYQQCYFTKFPSIIQDVKIKNLLNMDKFYILNIFLVFLEFFLLKTWENYDRYVKITKKIY